MQETTSFSLTIVFISRESPILLMLLNIEGIFSKTKCKPGVSKPTLNVRVSKLGCGLSVDFYSQFCYLINNSSSLSEIKQINIMGKYKNITIIKEKCENIYRTNCSFLFFFFKFHLSFIKCIMFK